MAEITNMPPAAADGVPSRSIVKYLQKNKNKNGATVSDVVRHLKGTSVACSQPQEELNKMVESLLQSGAELGFLERKGSRFINLLAKGACIFGRSRKSRCRRRRRRCSRRRRRSRRSCSCRRRRSRRSCSRRRHRSRRHRSRRSCQQRRR